MDWKPLDEESKELKILLLGNLANRDGPHLGYFWKAGNCYLSHSSPSWRYHPTHYIDLTDVSEPFMRTL